MADFLSLFNFIFIIMAMTYIVSDNPAFRFIEALLAGAMFGHFLAMTYASLDKTVIQLILRGNLAPVIPLILGLLMFATYIPKWRSIATYPTAIMAGVGLGVSLRALLRGQFLSQIQATVLPLQGVDTYTTITNIVLIATVVITVYYFIFGYDFKGPMLTLNKVGRALVMLALGAQAGNMFVSVGGTQVPYFGAWIRMLTDFIGSL